jgi:hypothetical protein
MLLVAESTVTVSCAVAKAFGYAINLENFSQWFPSVRSMMSANPLPPAAVGKEYLERVMTSAGVEQQISVRVQAVQVDRSFATEGEFPPLLPRMEMQFEPLESGCHITWRMFSRNDDAVSQAWFPMACRTMTERAQIAMAKLKERLEAGESMREK